MRKIYLARHGEPALPDGASCCLGREDLPLSGKGMREAIELRCFFAGKDLNVCSSPLKRANDTARIITQNEIIIRNGFSEISSGNWENRAFSEIKKLWPEQYAARGRDPWNTAPPGGESFAGCAGRIFAELFEILSKTSGDVLVVSHAGAIRSLLCLYSGRRDPFSLLQPYGGVSVLCENGGTISVVSETGFQESYPVTLPPVHAAPSREECFSLLFEKKLPAHIIRHSAEVAYLALEIAFELLTKGMYLDTGLIEAAALLHDISRLEKDHAAAGAQYVNDKSYPAPASVIAVHIDLPDEDGDILTEKSIVYLADKLILEDKRVYLKNRYEKGPPEAYKRAAAKLERASRLCREFEQITGKNISGFL